MFKVRCETANSTTLHACDHKVIEAVLCKWGVLIPACPSDSRNKLPVKAGERCPSSESKRGNLGNLSDCYLKTIHGWCRIQSWTAVAVVAGFNIKDQISELPTYVSLCRNRTNCEVVRRTVFKSFTPEHKTDAVTHLFIALLESSPSTADRRNSNDTVIGSKNRRYYGHVPLPRLWKAEALSLSLLTWMPNPS